ncbi:MAG: hypothetical protein NWF02_07780 [Candidatus Bathyarchaeota archaeon]|nr:hypothetical protein [Candidatus Bathyarchaeum sp.]
MTKALSDELEGNTLQVYSFVIKESRPVGPREVMRGANLSSPSVAYRQLQKLEGLGLIEKNELGEYIAREKTGVSGHVWIGKTLVPRMVFYSFFFIGIFLAEIVLVVMQLFIYQQTISLGIWYSLLITAVSMTIFLTESILTSKHKNNKTPCNQLID